MGYNLLYFNNIRNTEVTYVIQTAPAFLDRKPQVQLSSRALQLRRLTVHRRSQSILPCAAFLTSFIPHVGFQDALTIAFYKTLLFLLHASHVYGHTRVIFSTTTQTALSFCINFGIPCTNVNHYPANVENMVSYISK